MQGAAARVSGKCGKAYRGDCTWVIGWPPAGSVPGGIWAEEGSNDYLGYAPIDFQRDPRLRVSQGAAAGLIGLLAQDGIKAAFSQLSTTELK